MNCPKCEAHIAQPDTAECPSCGVLLAKASRPSPKRTYVRTEPAPPAKAESIPWSKIVLYFYREWCGYCKKLDREVLSTAKFGSTYPTVIKVKVNPERDGRAATLAEQYGIRGFPTIFVVPSKGRASSIVGYGGPDGFYTRLTEAVTR